MNDSLFVAAIAAAFYLRLSAFCNIRGSHRYQTPQQAWQELQRRRTPGLVHYRCGVCGGFHVGKPVSFSA